MWKRLWEVLKKPFLLPPLPTFLISTLGFGYALVMVILQSEPLWMKLLGYVGFTYASILSVTGLPYFVAAFGSVKRRVGDLSWMVKLRQTELAERLRDARFRIKVSLYRGLFINFWYITVKLASGIYYRSLWFVALACYYILLAAMRFLLLRRERKNPTVETELQSYRACGIMLLVMNEVLTFIVIFMVYQNQGFRYPGLLIYFMAIYAFYSAIAAVVSLIRFKKRGHPLLSAAKTVNFVAALMSILSLTTAMLTRFGEGEPARFRMALTGYVGIAVCMIVICLAVFMIWNANKQLKALRSANASVKRQEQDCAPAAQETDAQSPASTLTRS